VVNVAERIAVLRLRFNVQFRRLVEGNVGAEVFDDDGNGFAEIAVGRVAQQAGPGVRSGFDDHVMRMTG
jgi:hypothetical protein